MRTLIADVTLLPETDFAKARVGIRWHTGATDEVVVARSQNVTQYRRTDRGAIELARNLADLNNLDIARRLNAAGYTTGAGRPFDRIAVANLRHYHQVPQPGLLEDGELTVAEVARRLGIGHSAVVHWIARGWLSARVAASTTSGASLLATRSKLRAETGWRGRLTSIPRTPPNPKPPTS